MQTVPDSTIDIAGDLKGIIAIRNQAGWTGQAITFSRQYLDEARKIQGFNAPGVYLIWRPYEGRRLPIAYVGHANNVVERVNGHRNKDFWTHAILFVGNGLLRDHANYIETRLYERAKSQERCILENSNDPNMSLTGTHQLLADAHLPHILACLKLVGADFFEEQGIEVQNPQPSAEPDPYDTHSPLLHLASQKVKAKGYLMKNRSFLVLKDSQMVRDEAPSLKGRYRKALERRKELIAQNKVGEDTATTYKFLSDYTFEPDEKKGTAASFATGVLIGRNPSASTQWKDAQGKKLKEYLPLQS